MKLARNHNKCVEIMMLSEKISQTAQGLPGMRQKMPCVIKNIAFRGVWRIMDGI